MNVLLLGMRKRFLSGDWNPRQCKLVDIKRSFAEHEVDLCQHNISFQDFNTLYGRAACETITESWKETRAKEIGATSVATKHQGSLF